jgi:hypothetical protein
MKYSNLRFKTINIGLVGIGPHFVGSLSNAQYYSFNGNIMTRNVRGGLHYGPRAMTKKIKSFSWSRLLAKSRDHEKSKMDF